jgi:uncharacterized membrane protein
VLLAAGAVVLLNFAFLIAYQHYLAGDFPFQDEWGYVDRLRHLPETGFFYFLFDRYQTFYMPVYMFIWYLFYALAHLNIMVIRYTGAAVSALVSVVLCLMLYRRARQASWLTLLVILCGPFIVCSYNHWASYNQSIESVTEPLLFGLVLITAWIAEKTLPSSPERSRPLTILGWTGLCVAGWMFATGIYAPALVLLAAITGARILLYRRIDLSLVLLAFIAVAGPIWYVVAGGGLNQGMSAAHSALGLKDIVGAVVAIMGLAGNALFSPAVPSQYAITIILGACILLAQGVATVRALKLPADERMRLMIPLALTLYNLLVILEIVATRIHEPNVAFTPRYSLHTLGGPVSLLFWFVTLVEPVRWRGLLAATILATTTFGVVMADVQTIHQLPYSQAAMAGVRETLMSLHAQPNRDQQTRMYVTEAMLPLVYPGRLFLQEQHLAMYEGDRTTTTTATTTETASTQSPTVAPSAVSAALTIVDFGPGRITAKTPFNVQDNGESGLWLTLNQPSAGTVFIVLNGHKLRASHKDSVVAVGVPAPLYNKPGRYPLYVLEVIGKTVIRSRPVSLLVH